MSRTPLAMRTLLRQVDAQHRDAEVEHGDLDGLNVYRKVAFDAKTTEWLAPLAEVFGSDDRIESTYVRDGRLFVVFVDDIRADRAKPDFPLAGIEAVLNDEPPPSENASIEERADERRKELNGISVADLRSQYGYGEDDKTPKAEIISEILTSEGLGV